MMVTAKGTEYDKAQSLDLGADDYLVKPFGMMEFISRIKAHLRRFNQVSEKTVLVRGFELIPSEQAIYFNQTKLALTLKEYELLALFLRNLKRVFTRQKLLDSIWGEDYFGETRTVDMHITTLRSKLG